MKLVKAEVLRYLGYRGQAMELVLMQQIDRAISMCETLAKPKYVWGIFPDEAVNLPGADKTAVFAATVGHELVREIDSWQHRDMAFAAMLDAAATQAVEQTCDEAEREIGEWAKVEGLYPCARVSPGYGELPLALHEPILRLLDAGRKLGLMTTGSMILTPRKSVTALIAMHTEPVHSEGGCGACAHRDRCTSRRE